MTDDIYLIPPRERPRLAERVITVEAGTPDFVTLYDSMIHERVVRGMTVVGMERDGTKARFTVALLDLGQV